MKYALLFALLASIPALGAEAPASKPGVPKPGIKAVQVPFTALKPSHTFDVGGRPDWMVLTDDAIWMSNRPAKKVFRIDPATNTVTAVIEVPKNPCAGIATGFGSIWVPLCDDSAPALAWVDAATNAVTAIIPVGPLDSEGGIAVSPTGVYLFIDKMGTLARVDPSTNQVSHRIPFSEGARNSIFADGLIWVSDSVKNTISAFTPSPDAHTIVATIPVAHGPRFMTAGAGFLWSLNQGDGSVSKIDTKKREVVATIQVGIPGGDSVRFGFSAVWLTHLRSGLLWRIP